MSYDQKYRRTYYLLHKKQEKQYRKQYHQEHIQQERVSQRLYGRMVLADDKLVVLSYYGKEGKLQCCWPDCDIIDPDMLSLDHIKDDGAEHRRRVKGASGRNLYRLLRRDGFPEGYQTLCMNHQFKKELMRKREE